LRLAIAKRPVQPFEGGNRQFALLEGEDRLEGTLQLVDTPDTGLVAVIMTDDMGKPDAALQRFLAPRNGGMDCDPATQALTAR